MARSAARNEELRDATREAVWTAAVRLFARHGFVATKMRDIAVEAGISTGSIYRHYATKDELFADIVGVAVAGLGDTARLLRAGDPSEVILKFTRQVLDDLARDDGAAEFYVVVNHGFVADEPMGTRERLARAHRPMLAALVDLVERGQRGGQFAAGKPGELAACYLAVVMGLVTTRLVLGELPAAEVVVRVLTGRA